jgi:myosin-5
MLSKGLTTKLGLPSSTTGARLVRVSPFFYHRQTISLLRLEPLFQEIFIDTTVKAIRDGQDDLPPLRNPPLLETADDLATLSHLNEPSGALLPYI